MTTGWRLHDRARSVSREGGEAGPFAAERAEEPAAPHEPSRPKEKFFLPVREVMTRNVRVCRPGDTLAAAAIAMCEADCRFLPVVGEDLRPIGVVTDGDICLLGSTSHHRLSDMFVRDAMSRRPATCRADESVLAALKTMRRRRIRHLPVVDGQGRLEGVLSLTDVVLCAEEEGGSFLRPELVHALREMMQKYGDRRVIEHNPFVED